MCTIADTLINLIIIIIIIITHLLHRSSARHNRKVEFRKKLVDKIRIHLTELWTGLGVNEVLTNRGLL